MANPGGRADVLILGGGVIGLACAYYLLKSGRTVTLLERSTVGSGSSHGNCGTLTPSHLPLTQPGQVLQALKWMATPSAPLLVRPTLDPERIAWLLRFATRCNEQQLQHALSVKVPLLVQSRAMTEALVASEGLQCEFAPSGTLYVFRDAQKLEQSRRLLPRFRELGLEIRELDGAAAESLEPALLQGIAGAIHNVGDARLRPDRFVAELARRVRELGGQLIEGCEVSALRRQDNRILGADAAERHFEAQDVVLAMGAWSPGLARSTGLRLPMQPGKGYSITYELPALPPRIPLVLKETGVCVTCWDSGYRLASTLEFAGYDESLNPARLAALEQGARLYLREPLGPKVVERWYGWRPMSQDDLPIIGRAPALENLWLATGHGMLGMTLAAITGSIISDLVAGKPPDVDLEPFSPMRFDWPGRRC